ncbi:MAG: GNAT family N-acetyltransferase [Planctomycetes bacterium]|nr:GNAT family N-acetyltransferase [Planctomycetota bacterium]
MQKNMRIEIRRLGIEDFSEMEEVMKAAYPDIETPHWKKNQIAKLVKIFPDGQICVQVNGRVVACALSLIVRYNRFGNNHTYDVITGHGSFSTHDPSGDVLYGIDIFVHPEYQGMRLARRLYDARKALCENLNLRALIIGGRIPSYSLHSESISPQEYIRKVRSKELFDPVLTFQLSNDFHVIKVLRNYLQGDEHSREFAVLMEWNNIYFQSGDDLIRNDKSIVRLGLVQWQMRPINMLSDLMEQVEFFVDAISGYQADFLLLPEFFNAPLMARHNNLGESEAIRKLAAHTQDIIFHLAEMAVSYNINIIGGSMPEIRQGKLYNVSPLLRRDGTQEVYRKIHITPSEDLAWGMLGADRVEAFDSDCGKIGILICYDVQFPELGRRYADQGAQIIFVPFQTDTQNGYMRVRRCAQARAIENECYVAISGCVGNLPKVSNMDIQYAQSAIFTPSDFAFPTEGIKAEATPNTETTLIVDIDLDLLKELNTHGSVRNLANRRKDLYELKWKNPERNR